MGHGRLNPILGTTQFHESILPPITHPKIPTRLTGSGIEQKKEKTMIFAVVEMGPIPHTYAGIFEQFMWARNLVGTELS
jgi:hypothetical protein